MESFEIGSEHGQEVQERVGGGVNGGSSGDLLVDSVPRPYMVSLVPSLPPTPQTPHQVYMRPQVNFAGIGAGGIQGQYQQQQQRSFQGPHLLHRRHRRRRQSSTIMRHI